MKLINELTNSTILFKFSISQVVRLSASDETGTVVGVSKTVDAAPQYLVRYKTAVGGHSEKWFWESELVAL